MRGSEFRPTRDAEREPPGGSWAPSGSQRATNGAGVTKIIRLSRAVRTHAAPSGPHALKQQRRNIAHPAKLEQAAEVAAAARKAPVSRKAPPRACSLLLLSISIDIIMMQRMALLRNSFDLLTGIVHRQCTKSKNPCPASLLRAM